MPIVVDLCRGVGGGGDTRRCQMGIKRTTSQPTVECSVELHLRINILLLPAP